MVVWAVNVVAHDEDSKISILAPTAFREIFSDLSKAMIDTEVVYA